MPGCRLSVGSGRGVAAPGGVELLEPMWSCSSSPTRLEAVVWSADGMAEERMRSKRVKERLSCRREKMEKWSK